jgi:hypothetical protein
MIITPPTVSAKLPHSKMKLEEDEDELPLLEFVL